MKHLSLPFTLSFHHLFSSLLSPGNDQLISFELQDESPVFDDDDVKIERNGIEAKNNNKKNERNRHSKVFSLGLFALLTMFAVGRVI